MKPLSECRLYAFVDTAYLRGRAPDFVAQQLCHGGADLIQLRAKQSSTEQIQRIAEKLRRITSHAGVGLVINDHPDIAQAVGADFCHLGQEDYAARFPPPPNPQPAFGLSTHSPEQAIRAVSAGACYLGVGPVYATGTKPMAKPVTLDYVRWAAQNVAIPWFAIGGINLNNLHDVLAAGAKRICVVSAILNQEDIAAACRSFADLL